MEDDQGPPSCTEKNAMTAPEKCPTCGSDKRWLVYSVQSHIKSHDAPVQISCPDPWHDQPDAPAPAPPLGPRPENYPEVRTILGHCPTCRCYEPGQPAPEPGAEHRLARCPDCDDTSRCGNDWHYDFKTIYVVSECEAYDGSEPIAAFTDKGMAEAYERKKEKESESSWKYYVTNEITLYETN